ncbi:putative short-chain dehydrogenase [Xylariaceae sp. FL0255]|nr:putative short-chain dehydrogenase [Xylariaceae sp. FL0255]
MSDTIIITGANGSAGIQAAEYLLKSYPDYTAILTVSDTSDRHSSRLAQVTILQLDLADLSSYPPLKANVCNASYWSLVEAFEMTVEGFDKSIQVGHISRVLLVLRLISSFATNSSGRITHMSPNMPNLSRDRSGRGFTRYANAKPLATTWMCPLNRYLSQFRHISAVAINPGGLGDSRCFQTNTLKFIQLIARFVLKSMMPVINFFDPTFRSAAAAGVDIIDVAVNKAHPDYRGYLTLLQKDGSDPITRDEEVQQRVWEKSVMRAHITADRTALELSLQRAGIKREATLSQMPKGLEIAKLCAQGVITPNIDGKVVIC